MTSGNPLGFDPAAWLDSFAEAGGSYALTADGKLWLGEVGAPAGPWKLATELAGHPERVEALKTLVRQRSLIS